LNHPDVKTQGTDPRVERQEGPLPDITPKIKGPILAFNVRKGPFLTSKLAVAAGTGGGVRSSGVLAVAELLGKGVHFGQSVLVPGRQAVVATACPLTVALR
jgi:hypothetical protein